MISTRVFGLVVTRLTCIGGYLPKIARLLTDPKLLRPLANFIEASGRYDLDSGTGDFPVRVSQPQR
jgi:hypothetical protein